MVQQSNPPPVYISHAHKGGSRGAVLIGSLLGLSALSAGGYLLYSRYGLVRAKVSDFKVSPTSVKVGDTIGSIVSWQNSGVKPYDFDVVIFFGDLKTMTGWGGLIPKVSSTPLQKQDSTISITVPTGIASQSYDANAVICDATDLGGGQYKLNKVYALLTKQGLVTVGGGGPPPPGDSAGILAFSMSKA